LDPILLLRKDVKSRNINKAKRTLTTLAWVLAMVLPGGLPMLALWVTIKAARERAALRAGQPGELVTASASTSGPRPSLV
jgi:hypothetical protein